MTTEVSLKPPSLASKLAMIAKECSYVQKDKENSFHRYKYASAAAVLAKVNDALANHNVGATVRPDVISSEMIPTAKGSSEHRVTVRVTITLRDGDSGETVETSGLGSGQDNGDKAIMKAQTAGAKYAWLLALNISTGDDPEADEDVDKRTAAVPPPSNAAARKQAPEASAKQEPAKSEAAPAAKKETTPEDVAKVWVAKLATANEKNLFTCAAQVAGFTGRMKDLVWPAYVRRWGETMDAADPATAKSLLDKCETLPTDLRAHEDWVAIEDRVLRRMLPKTAVAT